MNVAAPSKKKMTAQEAKQSKLESNARTAQERMNKIREIGPLPEVKDPERKDACRNSLLTFIKTYHGLSYYFELSEDHLDFIEEVQRIILLGQRKAVAWPRGGGKSTILRHASEWAILFGYRRYLVIVAATADDAKRIMKGLKRDVSENPLLIADFPESCFPLACLDQEPLRCKSQMLDGEKTSPEWTADAIRFPYVPGSPASEATVTVTGIEGSPRGQSSILKDGSTSRPDIVFIDDPSSKKSAKSASQNAERLEIIQKDIKGMNGPGTSMACFLACTVIAPFDLADQVLDPELHPEWQGTRVKLLKKEPENQKLWQDYYAIYDQELALGKEDKDTNRFLCTDFYAANRVEMDKGAEVFWPQGYGEERFESTLEYAMYLKHAEPGYFNSEVQNEPTEEEATIKQATVKEFANKQGPEAKRVLPPWTQYVTAHIDVQGDSLVFAIVASKEDFTSQVVDYGIWPEQPRHDANKNNLNFNFDDAYPGLPAEAQTYQALEDLYETVLAAPFLSASQDGGQEESPLGCSRILVDVAYAETANAVRQFAANHANVYASRGKYFKTGRDQYNWLKPQNGFRCLRQCKIDLKKGEAGYNTNHWKTFLSKRVLAPLASPGCLSLYKASPAHHVAFAKGVLESEKPIEVISNGDAQTEWKEPPGAVNEPLDNLVGALVAAAIEGAAMVGDNLKETKPRKVRRFSLKERMAKKRNEKR